MKLSGLLLFEVNVQLRQRDHCTPHKLRMEIKFAKICPD